VQPAAAAHAVRHSGTGHLMGTWHVEFDGGVFNPLSSTGEDLKLDVNVGKAFDPDDAALILKMGTTKPTYKTCAHAALSPNSLAVKSSSVGKWYCLKTNSNRFVRFRVDKVEPYPGGVDMTYTTWQL
jgi:hypothetical protein